MSENNPFSQQGKQFQWPPWFDQPPPPPPDPPKSCGETSNSIIINNESAELVSAVPLPNTSPSSSGARTAVQNFRLTIPDGPPPVPRPPLNEPSAKQGQRLPFSPSHPPPSDSRLDNLRNQIFRQPPQKKGPISPQYPIFPRIPPPSIPPHLIGFPPYFDNTNFGNYNVGSKGGYGARAPSSSDNHDNPNFPPKRYFYHRYSNFNYNRRPMHRPYRRPAPYYSRWTPREVNDTSEPRTRSSRKRKKPLSQNNPSRKDWCLADVISALALERELNKKSKSHSLIIKFPDHELNKDIVASFHASIENVHFQQPSTPRFCFVTLKESADADSVIAELNKQKFGEGNLTAEYKKEREDEQSNNPEDIDPLALYVGNLAQEITKEDMVNLYPRSKRIDIGYAKKMKYTRYAFVRFRSAKDALQAFKNTHNKQMYNKSLIVRFRRLNGPVGMPGGTNSHPQVPKEVMQIDITDEPDEVLNEKEVKSNITKMEKTSPISSTTLDLWKSARANGGTAFMPISIKKELLASESEDEDYESKPIVREFATPFAEGSIDDVFAGVEPIKLKTEIKKETRDEDPNVDIDDNEDFEVQSSHHSTQDEPSSSNSTSTIGNYCDKRIKIENYEDYLLNDDGEGSFIYDKDFDFEDDDDDGDDLENEFSEYSSLFRTQGSQINVLPDC